MYGAKRTKNNSPSTIGIRIRPKGTDPDHKDAGLAYRGLQQVYTSTQKI